MQIVLPGIAPMQQAAAGRAPAALRGRTAGGRRVRRPQGLGSTTSITDDSATTRSVVDPETGEVRRFRLDGRSQSWVEAWDPDREAAHRWSMLYAAQNLLGQGTNWQIREKTDLVPYTELGEGSFCDLETRKLRFWSWQVKHRREAVPGTVNVAPRFRVVLCHRQGVGESPEVWRAASGNYSFHKVGVCGSAWTCPQCSRRISLGRREQIAQAYEAVDAVGGSAYMITFTIRHGVGDDCADLVAKLKDAAQLLQKSKAHKDALRQKPLVRPREDSLPFLDHLGRITALEVTHGANGWHPHEHQLWFFRRRLSVVELKLLEERLFSAWADACGAVGLPAPKAGVGLDIRQALTAEDYLSKFGRERRWGVESELAATNKLGRAKGRTPMQLLSDYTEGDEASGALFATFAAAFNGRHQLQFSRRLHAFLKEHGQDVDDSLEGDEALAQALAEQSTHEHTLSQDGWRRIVKNRVHGLFLALCRSAGIAVALEFVDTLPCDGSSVGADGKVIRSGILTRQPVRFERVSPEGNWGDELAAVAGRRRAWLKEHAIGGSWIVDPSVRYWDRAGFELNRAFEQSSSSGGV